MELSSRKLKKNSYISGGNFIFIFFLILKKKKNSSYFPYCF